MKAKFLLAVILCYAVASNVSGQCDVTFSYTQVPNLLMYTFTVDSVTDRGNGLVGSPQFVWQFSDGYSATGQQISRQFNLLNGGTEVYDVCVTMSDSVTGCSATSCDSLVVTGNPSGACSTVISYTNSDSVYTFTTTSGGTMPYTYEWSVDGQSAGTSSVLNRIITGALNGGYTEVCVTVTDSSGCQASDCAYISTNPQGNCNVYAVYTNVDSVYTFIASYIGAGPVVYQWTYNNNLYGTGDSLILVLDSAAISPNGAAVCVQITDANGCMATSCAEVADTFPAGQAPCQAYFAIEGANLNGDTSGNYYGVNLSTGNYGSDILWSFGDGATSTNPYPTHTYAQPGIYIVCLTIGVPGTSCYSTYCDSSFYVSRSAVLMHSLSITAPAGISQPKGAPAISIYPNPVSDVLNISGFGRIEQESIFNITGQKVYEAKSTDYQIDVSKLSPGVYILQLTANGMVSRTKFVKD